MSDDADDTLKIMEYGEFERLTLSCVEATYRFHVWLKQQTLPSNIFILKAFEMWYQDPTPTGGYRVIGSDYAFLLQTALYTSGLAQSDEGFFNTLSERQRSLILAVQETFLFDTQWFHRESRRLAVEARAFPGAVPPRPRGS